MGQDLNNKFIVCIDSDGCAIDSMTIKHVECFGPSFIEVWNITNNKEEILKKWNEINLYSSLRGINRFQGLVKILKIFKNIEKSEDVKILEHWVKTTKALSPTALKEYKKQFPNQIFDQAIVWSELVNKKIEDLPISPPFENVLMCMEGIKEQGDIAVVSSGNDQAIKIEWNHWDMMEYVNYFYSQDNGTKSECIDQLIKKGYDPKKMLMIGDALGDLEAAQNNGIWFYPILAGHEKASWIKMKDTFLKIFIDGNFNKEVQELLIKEMNENLID